MKYHHAVMLAIATAPVLVFAAPLSKSDHAIIMHIADSLGVPESVADRMQIEESGDPMSGAWGESSAIGPKGSDGARCLGLYQLNPRCLDWLVSMFFPCDATYFEWDDPIDNAIVALGYMRWLHDQFGSWYNSACAFNAGPGTFRHGLISHGDKYSKTREYARRIIGWSGGGAKCYRKSAIE